MFRLAEQPDPLDVPTYDDTNAGPRSAFSDSLASSLQHWQTTLGGLQTIIHFLTSQVMANLNHRTAEPEIFFGTNKCTVKDRLSCQVPPHC